MHGVVVPALGFDDDGGLLAGAKPPLEGQVLVAELADETFDGTVMPGLARVAQSGCDAGPGRSTREWLG